MSTRHDKEEKYCGFFKVRNLPDPALKPFWFNIVINKSIRIELLNHASLGRKLDDNTRRDCAIYNFILLYGPPGTGKTSLAVGCANEVAEREYTKTGKRTKLLELNVSTLFSEFLGRSVKAMSESFDGVRLVARHDPVILLLDEIESIGIERASLGPGDPSDVGRSVTAFLTELDELRSCKDVLILATSNIEKWIDQAVLDRSDTQLYIGRPGRQEAKRILESNFSRLRRFGITVEPTFFERFVNTFYSNDGAAGPFSGRSLCCLLFKSVCRLGSENLTSQSVLSVAKSMKPKDVKEKEDGSIEEENVSRS